MSIFDPFPYKLLIMSVSLEAIFLSPFVLISQNRLGEENVLRADLDLYFGLLTEHELTRVSQMLDVIQDKQGIVDHKTALWRTLIWKPSHKMYWQKSILYNSISKTKDNRYEKKAAFPIKHGR